MTIRNDWKRCQIRRNYRHGAVVMLGAPRIARRLGSSKSWQRDASRGVSSLASRGSRARARKLETVPANGSTRRPYLRTAWDRLEGWIRSVMSGLRWTGGTPIDASS